MSLRGVEIPVYQKGMLGYSHSDAAPTSDTFVQQLPPTCNRNEVRYYLKFVIHLVAFNKNKVRILFIVHKIRVNDLAEILCIVIIAHNVCNCALNSCAAVIKISWKN